MTTEATEPKEQRCDSPGVRPCGGADLTPSHRVETSKELRTQLTSIEMAASIQFWLGDIGRWTLYSIYGIYVHLKGKGVLQHAEQLIKVELYNCIF